MFTYNDAALQRNKAARCREFLVDTGMKADGFDRDYNEFPSNHEGLDLATPDIVLCFANENNIWNTIQQQYPPICFHATTSKSWGIHVGRHIPLVENCLVCTFQNYIQSEIAFKCAEAEIHPHRGLAGEPSNTAILPFLAPAAALVTLSELIKVLGLGVQVRENSIEFNMSTANGVFLSTFQSFGNCYACRHQHVLYHRFGQVGKHWHLSLGQ
jgi:hypothetical protein